MLDSPVNDFSRATLGAVSGTLGKLQYVAGLRQGNGDYFHWGMARTHGEDTANLAIGESHTTLFLTVLRTPIRVLWEEASELASQESTEVNDYVGKLQAHGEMLVPSHLDGGVRRHFNSVLLALCCLAGVRAPRTDRGA